jgi:hypothetical protein
MFTIGKAGIFKGNGSFLVCRKVHQWNFIDITVKVFIRFLKKKGADFKEKCQTPQLPSMVLYVCFAHDMLCIVHEVRRL